MRLRSSVWRPLKSVSTEPQLASMERSAVLVTGATANIQGERASFDPHTTLQRPTAVVAGSEPASLGIRSDVARRSRC